MREPFGDEHLPHGVPVALDNPQLAAILIFIAVYRRQVERPLPQELNESLCRPPTQRGLGSTGRLSDFGSVYVRDTYLLAIQPECIAIDHAGRTPSARADAK